MKLYYKFHNKTLPPYFHDFPFKDNIISDVGNQRPRRQTIRLPVRFENGITELPQINPIIKISNSNRLNATNCIRFHIPNLVNKLYLPEIAREKVFTHSIKGFKNYAKCLIIDKYESVCDKATCFICNS